MNPKMKQKNLIAPLLVLVGGLVSAFVIAPITGQKKISADYERVERSWKDMDGRAQKNVLGWFKSEDTKPFQNGYAYLKETFESTKKNYEKHKNNYSVNDLQDLYYAIKVYRMTEDEFNRKHSWMLNSKENIKAKIAGYQTKQKTLNIDAENLVKQIEGSSFEQRHKKILQDSLAVYQYAAGKLKTATTSLESFCSSEYEGKASVDEKELTKYEKEADTQIRIVEEAYTKAANLYVGFANAPQTVPVTIQAIKTNIANIQKELNSPTQPKILATSSKAMHKTDSLLKVCVAMLPAAEAKANAQEYIDAFLILEKMSPAEIALSHEYSFQKESYNNFIADYNAIDKDLKAIKGATVNSSDRSSVDRLSNEALVAQQLAWQYAMAGNWVYAQSQLRETSQKSDKVYNLAFKKPSSRYSSSSSSYSGSSNKYSSGNSYSSSKSSSGSSSSGYKSSSGSSYSSSSKKSDSRSWSSSSSSSSKKSSSSSSSSSSRRSDSRSWGSSSRKRR